MMNFSCPIPNFEFDTITLGHGSGGVLTQRLLDQGVFSVLENPMLNEKHDGAIFQLDGPLAFSTDSYVVHPVFFPGGNIGDLAINGTINDLAMCGARAKYLSLSFILEEGLPIKEFWEILQSIGKAAAQSGVQIITGDTKVVERGKGDKIFINTSGVGQVLPAANISYKNIAEGDAIILSGPLAAHGIAIMSLREGLEFETQVESDTQTLVNPVVKMIEAFGKQIHFLRDATRGGLGSALNEAAGAKGVGMLLQEKQIPVAAQVQAACEILGLDPLYVANEGVFVVIVDGAIKNDVFQLLKNNGCADASIIGEVHREPHGKVLLKSGIGGTRVVNMLPGEQLPRIC